MRDPAPPPARRAALLLAVPLLAVLLLAGCATLGETSALSDRLGADGFQSPNVGFQSSTGSGDELDVSASGHSTLSGDAALTRAAQLTWTTYPRHLDRIALQVGPSSATVERGELTALFGPRDPSLDARSTGDDVAYGFRTAVIVIGLVVLVLVVGVVALVVVLVRRHRRRSPPGPPGPPPGPFGPGPPPGPPRPPPGPFGPGPPPPGGFRGP